VPELKRLAHANITAVCILSGMLYLTCHPFFEAGYSVSPNIEA